MKPDYVAEARVTIKAPAGKVWHALTDPALVKKYFFGTDVETDWKPGSPIYYRGEWKGRAYEDKGAVIEVQTNRKLVTTHWSPLSGVPDAPENYHTVTYLLNERDGVTELVLRQDHNASEEEKVHSEQNWRMVLDGLKKMLETG